jgi:simple sugar transport system ATP-binding protein
VGQHSQQIVTTAPVAETVGVSKRFGATEALRGVSVAVSGQNRGVHALVGRNGAGKSTLVGILTGLIKPDAGEVRFAGEPAPPVTARERWRQRVACVYQRSTVIPTMTVGENLFLNAYPNQRAGFVNWRSMRVDGQRLLDEWGIAAHINSSASELPVGQRQLLEIVRALRLGSRFIILDEPTAQLEKSEIVLLFEHMKRLQAGGVAFMYISHHLDEIYEVCDFVSILRDGSLIATAPVRELSKSEVISAMVGAAQTNMPSATDVRTAPAQSSTPVLSVRDLTIKGWCSEVSFDVAAGEFVGLAGLGASGKAQVAEAVAGIRKADGGRVALNGQAIKPGRVDLAIAGGIGYLPGDRQVDGFCPNVSVEENVTMSVLGHLGPAGLVDLSERERKASGLIALMQVVLSSPKQLPSELSGGNQQKTVFARAVASDPKALVLVTPTAGVDVASKHALLEKIQQSGTAVLLVSDELDELAICDRILVMFGGQITGEFPRGWHDRDLVAAMEGVARVGG